MRNVLKSIIKNYLITLIIISAPVTLYSQENTQENSKNNSGIIPAYYDSNAKENYAIINIHPTKFNNAEDSTLANEILKKIQNNVFYGIFDWLTVSCKNDTVTLGGWVHWPWLKNQYETEVEKISGVKEVINNIQNTFGPGEVGFRAAQLIYNDPAFWGSQYSSNPPVHIIVNNGVVLLFGEVGSEAEKGLAETLVNFRTNAVSVQNNLIVKNNK